MTQTSAEQPLWKTEARRAVKVGAVVAGIITLIGGIPAFMIMAGPDPSTGKIVQSLGSLLIAFLGYWLICSMLVGLVRLAAIGLSRLLGRGRANLK
jgi:hypothetical protein